MNGAGWVKWTIRSYEVNSLRASLVGDYFLHSYEWFRGDIVTKNDILATVMVKERKLQSQHKTAHKRQITNNKLKPCDTRSTKSVYVKLTSDLPYETLASGWEEEVLSLGDLWFDCKCQRWLSCRLWWWPVNQIMDILIQKDTTKYKEKLHHVHAPVSGCISHLNVSHLIPPCYFVLKQHFFLKNAECILING